MLSISSSSMWIYYSVNNKDLPMIIRSSTEISLLTILWQQMADLSLESTANYISDKYLIALAEKAQDKELVSELKKFKTTSIGTIAPDFLLEKTYGDVTTKTKLSELNTAKEYIDATYPNRHSLILGDSTVTVPKFSLFICFHYIISISLSLIMSITSISGNSMVVHSSPSQLSTRFFLFSPSRNSYTAS